VPIRGERWRLIPSHPAYEASNLGRIRRRSTDRVIAQRLHHRDGYLQSGLHTLDGRKRTVFVHVLVAEAWLGRRPDNHEVDHVLGIKTDNRPRWLRYVTRSTNMKACWRRRLWFDAWRKAASSAQPTWPAL